MCNTEVWYLISLMEKSLARYSVWPVKGYEIIFFRNIYLLWSFKLYIPSSFKILTTPNWRSSISKACLYVHFVDTVFRFPPLKRHSRTSPYPFPPRTICTCCTATTRRPWQRWGHVGRPSRAGSAGCLGGWGSEYHFWWGLKCGVETRKGGTPCYFHFGFWICNFFRIQHN